MRLKKVAREISKTQAQDAEMSDLCSEVGTKRPGNLEYFEKEVSGTQKKPCNDASPLALNRLLHQWWLPSSTTGCNDYLWMELPGTWEPLDSLGVARFCTMVESQSHLPCEDEAKTKRYGKVQKVFLSFQLFMCS